MNNSQPRNDASYLEWKKGAYQHQDAEYSRLASEMTVWQAETAKHIAILNLAGLAGVFALLSSPRFSPEQLSTPAIIFAVSSVLAVLNMYVGAELRSQQLGHCNAQIERLNKDDEKGYQANPDYKYRKHWNFASSIIGWGSMLLTLGAGYLLFVALSTPSTA